MLSIPFREKLEAVMNHLLYGDESAMEKTGLMRGKVIAMKVEGPEITFLIQFFDKGIRILDEYDGEPHVHLSASPLTYLSILLKRSGPGHMPAEMKIQGDVGLAQQFQQLLQELDVDWEEQLSRWTGDTAARQLGRLYRYLYRYLGEVRQTAGLSIREYLLYENEILPEREEMHEFIHAVGVLRNDSERLVQRVQKLEELITGTKP